MVAPFVLIKLLSVAQAVEEEEEEAPMVVTVAATIKAAEAMEEAQVDMVRFHRTPSFTLANLC